MPRQSIREFWIEEVGRDPEWEEREGKDDRLF